MKSILTLPLTVLVTLLFLSITPSSSAMAINWLSIRQLIGDSGLLGGLLAEGATTAAATSGTIDAAAAAASTVSSTSTSATATSTTSTEEPTTTSSTSTSSTPTTTSTTPTTTSTTPTSAPSTSSTPTTSSSVSTPTTVISTTAPPSSSDAPVVVTTVITRDGSTISTQSTRSTSRASSSASPSQSAAGLSSGNDSGNSSGLSSSSRNTIIGVVCGIGGAIILAALGVLAWRIWGRKKDDDEDDLYDPNATNHLANDEKSRNAALESDANPFKRTLDQYHNPGPVNTASNF